MLKVWLKAKNGIKLYDHDIILSNETLIRI